MEAAQLSELEKCRQSPYYFVKNYCVVKGGPNLVDHMTEEQFNNMFEKINTYGLKRILKGR